MPTGWTERLQSACCACSSSLVFDTVAILRIWDHDSYSWSVFLLLKQLSTKSLRQTLRPLSVTRLLQGAAVIGGLGRAVLEATRPLRIRVLQSGRAPDFSATHGTQVRASEVAPFSGMSPRSLTRGIEEAQGLEVGSQLPLGRAHISCTTAAVRLGMSGYLAQVPLAEAEPLEVRTQGLRLS